MCIRVNGAFDNQITFKLKHFMENKDKIHVCCIHIRNMHYMFSVHACSWCRILSLQQHVCSLEINYHLVMKESIHAINVVFQYNIEWPEGDDLVKVMDGFKTFFGLPFIHGTIDVTQIHL